MICKCRPGSSIMLASPQAELAAESRHPGVIDAQEGILIALAAFGLAKLAAPASRWSAASSNPS